MIAWLSASLTAWLSIDPALLAAIEYTESRGQAFAVSEANCVGVLQVDPRWSVVPRPLLFLPVVNRLEGARIYARWRQRAANDDRVALRAFACGNKGLRPNPPAACVRYADAVLGRVGR